MIPDPGPRVRSLPCVLRAVMAALALICGATVSAPARAERPAVVLEAGATASLIAGGASNAYLRPGTQRPEATLLVSPRPFLGLRTTRFGVSLAYAPAFKWSVASSITGHIHDGRLALRLRASDTVLIDGLVSGSYAAYAGEGASEEASTLALIATQTGSVGAGLGLRWQPDGPLALRTAAYATRGHSRAVTRDGQAPEPVDDLRFEGTMALSWRLTSAVEIWAGPLAEMRHANRARLSFWGLGGELGGVSRLWPSGGIEGSVRAQQNLFGGHFPRDDLFARFRVAVWHEVGDHARLALRYAYSANGSALAAYDADRHLVVAVLAMRTPTWRR